MKQTRSTSSRRKRAQAAPAAPGSALDATGTPVKDPKAKQWLTKADGLATRLRQLRGDRSGLSFAKDLNWVSSKITRIEQGIQVPSIDDVKAWAALAGASQSETEGLLALLAEFQSIRGVFKQRASRPEEPIHTDASALIATATLVRTYSTWSVPPIAQTPTYARAILEEQHRIEPGLVEDFDGAVEARLRRQGLLYESQRRFEFIVDESVLYRRHCPIDGMREQLDRLLTLTTMPKDRVRFGVIPADAPVVVPPMHSFAVYDDQVFVELFSGDEPAATFDPNLHVNILAKLWTAAVEGEQARKLIMRAIEALPES